VENARRLAARRASCASFRATASTTAPAATVAGTASSGTLPRRLCAPAGAMWRTVHGGYGAFGFLNYIRQRPQRESKGAALP
jgi:hypothetical protein